MSTTATQRRPMRAVPAAVPHGHHHVFPVRFTPIAGLSGLLRRPQNSYRWIGAGTLLVDEHGVRVSARRLSLLGLYRTVLFILPTEIREVYREGDSIRIDLQSGARHDFFHVWAENANAAAQIVARLPTSRTIELEGPAWNGGGSASSAQAYRSALWLALAVFMVGALAWVGVEQLFSDQEPLPAETATKAPDLAAPFAGHGAGPGSNVQTLEARADLERFNQRFDVLGVQFSTAFDALQKGNLSQAEFADGLEKWLLPQWEALGAELVPTTANPNAVRAVADLEIRGVIDNWHRALMSYAHGLRTHDSTEVFDAFNYLKGAETHQIRTRELLDRLDEQQR